MPLPTRASRGTYCRALGRQGVKDPSILHWHRGLHFEFELVFEQIVPDSADMPLIIVLIYPLERKTLPLSTLHELWSGLPSNGWPDAVNISSLRFVRQIDTVYLAETPGPGGKELTIFIGHRLPGLAVSRELRFLLTSRPIRTSCRKPLGIVTKRSAFGSKQGIVGFLLRYLPAGSIRDILPAKQRAGTLSNRVTVQVELVPAGHKRNHPRSSLESVSDRRPDTVLLDGDRGVVLLCDFEQCNAATGMSVRIHYTENVRAALLPFTELPYEDLSVTIVRLLAGYTPVPRLTESPVQAMNWPWSLLTPAAQDKVAVYSLKVFISTASRV